MFYLQVCMCTMCIHGDHRDEQRASVRSAGVLGSYDTLPTLYLRLRHHRHVCSFQNVLSVCKQNFSSPLRSLLTVFPLPQKLPFPVHTLENLRPPSPNRTYFSDFLASQVEMTTPTASFSRCQHTALFTAQPLWRREQPFCL